MDKEKQKNTLKTFLSREYNKLVNYAKMYFTERFFETDVEDIIQEVALNIYAKLEFDTPVENITAYFYRAMRNKIIDYQRNKRHNVSLENFKTDREEERLPVMQMDDISETEELFYQEELQDKGWDALARLNPDQQAIIVET